MLQHVVDCTARCLQSSLPFQLLPSPWASQAPPGGSLTTPPPVTTPGLAIGAFLTNEMWLKVTCNVPAEALRTILISATVLFSTICLRREQFLYWTRKTCETEWLLTHRHMQHEQELNPEKAEQDDTCKKKRTESHRQHCVVVTCRLWYCVPRTAPPNASHPWHSQCLPYRQCTSVPLDGGQWDVGRNDAAQACAVVLTPCALAVRRNASIAWELETNVIWASLAVPFLASWWRDTPATHQNWVLAVYASGGLLHSTSW